MSHAQATPSRFPLGQIVITPNALATIPAHAIQDGLSRHARGDWGDVCAEDAALNDEELHSSGRVLSAYGTGPQRFWIITDADCFATTILMPEDY